LGLDLGDILGISTTKTSESGRVIELLIKGIPNFFALLVLRFDIFKINLYKVINQVSKFRG
jgi:hypothetical protein